jgi:energy-coupling factor transporter transmembrane protein EcfT
MDVFLTDWCEWVVDKVMFWESDKARKGRILRSIHHFLTNVLIVLIVLSHTIYRSFWIQTLVLIFVMFVWVHHMLVGDCVISCVERKMTDSTSNFWHPAIEFFGIEPTKDTGRAVMLAISTTSFVFLSLEWIANVLWGLSRIIHPFS